jgi:DNA mismatch endonuclease (patch repair protein)
MAELGDRVSEPRGGYETSEGTRRAMRGNVSRDTSVELKLRRALWAAGLRGYRKNYKKLPGKPDVVFTRAKLAIFVHGCYWHRCPHCTRNLTPTANSAYWTAKFARNVERDKRHVEELKGMGFETHIVWECQVARSLSTIVSAISDWVLSRRLRADNRMSKQCK